jgi:hypothetical protein
MNKAFVRDPDGGDERCPACGSVGTPVSRDTIRAHVQPEAVTRLAESGYFCPYARCDMVYFDQFARCLERDTLLHPVYPKDADAPICGCFGFSIEDIERDVQEGVPARIRALLARSKSPEARCAERAVDGQCCVAEVQRCYMRLRQAAQR